MTAWSALKHDQRTGLGWEALNRAVSDAVDAAIDSCGGRLSVEGGCQAAFEALGDLGVADLSTDEAIDRAAAELSANLADLGLMKIGAGAVAVQAITYLRRRDIDLGPARSRVDATPGGKPVLQQGARK